MLMPKKVKYRKQQRGRMAGKAWRGSELSFGDYGLKVLECGHITDRQIEASRIAMTRFVKRGGKVWLRLRHSVLYVDLVDVGIRVDVKGNGKRHRSVVCIRRLHIEHVVNAAHLLFEWCCN